MCNPESSDVTTISLDSWLDNTAPLVTWNVKTCAKRDLSLASLSLTALGIASNASFVGANTVKGPGKIIKEILIQYTDIVLMKE